jgi:predicted nucleic-acid-binding protein
VAALDTNILVRLIVEDDSRQLAAAERLLRRTLDDGETLFVPVTVFLELEWVLRTTYGFDKATVVTTLAMLLGTRELAFDAETALELSLVHYRDRNADYSDCLHAALAAVAGESPLWTFDRAAAKREGAKRLA